MLTPEQVCAHEGIELLSVTQFVARFAALGYRVNRTMDCRSVARFMTGPLTGESYPACSTGINEADTGLRAWNVDARRDSNYRRMQALRVKIGAISRGMLLQV